MTQEVGPGRRKRPHAQGGNRPGGGVPTPSPGATAAGEPGNGSGPGNASPRRFSGELDRDRVRDLARAAAERAAETEAGRRLPPDLVRAFRDAGIFRLLTPRELGGVEAHPGHAVDVIETLACGDGAAGWCAMIGATSGLVGAYLPPAAVDEIFPPAVIDAGGPILGGVFAPLGRAVAEGEAWRVRGRWPFASGCQHCDWLLGGCVLEGRDASSGDTTTPAAGPPRVKMLLFPAAAVRTHDTWHVAGMRGTGSHDLEVDGLLVPHHRAVSFGSDRPLRGGPLYAFPPFGMLAIGVASVALGVARGAIADLIDLARAKTPTGSRRRLAERPSVQTAVARATARIEAQRLLLDAAIDRAWGKAVAGEAIDLGARADLRLAATEAARCGAKVVTRMYELGGGSAIYDTSPLQRRLRDAHVITQHVMVGEPTYEVVGRVLLGIDVRSDEL